MKNFKLVVSLLVGIFALSIMGNTAFAAGSYDNIADGEYNIEVRSLEKGGTDVSGADNFIHNPSLTIKDGNTTLTLEVGAGDGPFAGFDFSIDWVTVDGKKPISEREDGNSTYFTFQLNEVKTNIPAGMQYVVPGVFPDGHAVEFDLELTGLDALPVKDDTTEKPAEEDNNGAENNEETETPVEEETAKEPAEDNTTAETEDEDTDGAVEQNTTTENNDSNGAVETADDKEAVKNPQTGDTSNIWLYVFLLVGAVIPLAIKFKKHIA